MRDIYVPCHTARSMHYNNHYKEKKKGQTKSYFFMHIFVLTDWFSYYFQIITTVIENVNDILHIYLFIFISSKNSMH